MRSRDLNKTFKTRTGIEIYDALFDRRKTEYVKIFNYQDKVLPKIKYATWLHFKTCPNELERILSKNKFDINILATDKWNGKIPFGETLEWFNPKKMGDSIIVYEFSINNSKY